MAGSATASGDMLNPADVEPMYPGWDWSMHSGRPPKTAATTLNSERSIWKLDSSRTSCAMPSTQPQKMRP